MRGNQKNKYYKLEWSPKFAYVVGLITADGNLSKDGRHIDFTSKDRDLVEIFKECMDLDNKIGRKSARNKEKKYFHVQFSHVKLYRDLESIGFMPNKSKIISEVKIPNGYFPDFIRGYFDGDGSCNSYWDERWKNSFMFYLKFSSTSENFIRWIRRKIKDKVGINGSTEHYKYKEENWEDRYMVKYAKEESKKLIDTMYYKDDLPYLIRKKDKIDKILETNQKAYLNINN